MLCDAKMFTQHVQANLRAVSENEKEGCVEDSPFIYQRRDIQLDLILIDVTESSSCNVSNDWASLWQTITRAMFSSIDEMYIKP